MIYLQTAFDVLVETAEPVGAEPVALSDAHERVLAADVRSPMPVPPFRRAMMDGYAVRRADVATAAPDRPVRLSVTGRVVAGHVPADDPSSGPAPGEAWEIATGAPVPASADGVVPVEWTDAVGPSENGGEPQVDVRFPLSKSNVAPPGEDLERGVVVAESGTDVTAPVVGLLASVGIDTVRVHRRPRVAVLVTGSELAGAGEPLPPGFVYDCNGPAMRARIEAAGAEVIRCDRRPDDAESLAAWIDEAVAENPDLILSSGGVSVGDRDLVPDVWRRRGAEELFWRIAIKPGKPVYAALGPTPASRRILALGLSGTPAANAVVFELLVRPVLHRLQGRRAVAPPLLRVRLTDGYPKPADMTRLLWARLSGRGEPYDASLAPVLDATKLQGLCRANAVVVMPQGEPAWEAGQEAWAVPLDRPPTASTISFEQPVDAQAGVSV